MNYQKLKGLIRAKGLTYDKVSQKTGIGISALNNKLNNVTKFNVQEVKKVADCLDIQSNEIVDYFFNEDKEKEIENNQDN